MERLQEKCDVGVVVGRFQVDKLHSGHVELLDWMTDNHNKVIVVLGVAPVKVTKNNPLDFEARYRMINLAYPNFICVPMVDTRDDYSWSNNLDKLVSNLVTPGQTVMLYGARDSFIQYYKGRYKTQELVGKEESWSGSKVRDFIRKRINPSPDFRQGVIWATANQYPRVIPTVDVACVNRFNEVLLVKKPGESKWRFPGGFCEPNSVYYISDALRELEEETGVKSHSYHYICDVTIDDWRYKAEQDRIHTTFFRCSPVEGNDKPKAADDVCEAKWIHLGILQDTDFVEEHVCLFSMLKDYEEDNRK